MRQFRGLSCGFFEVVAGAGPLTPAGGGNGGMARCQAEPPRDPGAEGQNMFNGRELGRCDLVRARPFQPFRPDVE